MNKNTNKIRTIKAKFKWTELMKICEVRSTFKNVTTEAQDLTFEEIEKFHAQNQKSNGKAIGEYGYLVDDYGHCSVRMPMGRLRRKVEGRAVPYLVNLDSPELRFYPVVKTEEQLNVFNLEVKACGSLD